MSIDVHPYLDTSDNERNRTMNTRNYSPQPLDTDDVRLPEELNMLAEQLAKNVHEVWAAGRLSQGWTWGPERSDPQRTHPCLVPYEELSEEEKDYDRHTAIGTLKFILKKGFSIAPPAPRQDP